MIRKILLALLVLFIAIQFYRPARNNGDAAGPHDITHYVHVPDTVMAILKSSCYDCHSNHTEYPWYTNINPVGWWMRGHINDGKRGLNFSDLSSMDNQKIAKRLTGVARETAKGDMPLPSYTWIHTYAKLDAGQRQIIKEWTDSAKVELNVKM